MASSQKNGFCVSLVNHFRAPVARGMLYSIDKFTQERGHSLDSNSSNAPLQQCFNVD
jgi:hypothetical protein